MSWFMAVTLHGLAIGIYSHFEAIKYVLQRRVFNWRKSASSYNEWVSTFNKTIVLLNVVEKPRNILLKCMWHFQYSFVDLWTLVMLLFFTAVIMLLSGCHRGYRWHHSEFCSVKFWKKKLKCRVVKWITVFCI